jgi:hypothetical protein
MSSVVLAAFVSAIIAMVVSERRMSSDNVLLERKRWRDDIRKLAIDVYNGFLEGDSIKLKRLKLQFSVLLNPHDDDDKKILDIISDGNPDRADEFSIHISLLLKHDWERAKYEASIWRWVYNRPPERCSFETYNKYRRYNYRRCHLCPNKSCNT